MNLKCENKNERKKYLIEVRRRDGKIYVSAEEEYVYDSLDAFVAAWDIERYFSKDLIDWLLERDEKLFSS